jgi:hypothetical protein
LIRFVDCVGFTLGGFIAGEGSFIITRQSRLAIDGTPRPRWVFQVTVATRDRHLLVALQQLLGVGSIADRSRRKAHWQPTSTYAVTSQRAQRDRVIPFAHRYLLPGAKRDQFELWRAAYEHFQTLHPNRFGLGPSTCSEPGCDKPVRGRGLCRSHYYHATGY